MHPLCRFAVLAMSALALLAGRAAAQDGKIEFNRDVRPILAEHCFVCHGPDNHKRKAKLRLDVEKDAYETVIVPGKPAESMLVKRITTDDVFERMPPESHNKPLSKQQIETLQKWIAQGAKYEKHWSLIPPKLANTPVVKNNEWVLTQIDPYILARLEKEGMSPSPEADRRTLIRRLSFDLIGLPPTPEEVDAFLADKLPGAYERVVDRLLESKHFGERMAVHWLDVVRYADTAGYHSDNHRHAYLYRDWVIDAFNNNLRFRDFAVDQIAGDLLPGATNDQKVASGHNRLLQTTEEGGSQAKEYTAKYAADRVRNFATAWLGLTLGCTECHDHKYDPFTTREFYKLEAFFSDIQEVPVGRQPQTPIVRGAEAERLKKFEQEIAALQKEIADMGGKEQAKELQAKLVALQKQKDGFLKTVPTTLVSTAIPPRTVHMLKRGNWLDESGEVVQPDVPASLPPLAALQGKKRADRVDLAHWLVPRPPPPPAPR